MRKEGLEPSRFYPPDPKSGASANSATFALWIPDFILYRVDQPEGLSNESSSAITDENR